MSMLKALLGRYLDKNADELRLEPNAVPVAILRGVPIALTPHPLSVTQFRSMVEDVALRTGVEIGARDSEPFQVTVLGKAHTFTCTADHDGLTIRSRVDTFEAPYA